MDEFPTVTSPPPEPPRQGRLDFIRPRLTRRIQIAREGRMAAFVGRLRMWLPMLAGTVLLLLFIWPSLLPTFRMSNIVKTIPNLVIQNLRFSGVDDKNQPYSVTAAQATQALDLRGVYDLTKPEGEITLRTGEWLDGKADAGRFDEAGKRLWLGGNVHVFHDKGYQFTTEELQANLKSKEAWGDKSVILQGDMGTIHGVGFRFMNGGNTIIIKGPAKAVLSLHKRAASDKPSLH